MSSQLDFAALVPAWLAQAGRSSAGLGLDPEEAFLRAAKLLEDLRSAQVVIGRDTPNGEQAEVLHALVTLVCQANAVDAGTASSDTEIAFGHIASLPWPSDLFGGPTDLLSRLAVRGWRLERRLRRQPRIVEWRRRLCVVGEPSALGNTNATTALTVRSLLVNIESLWLRIETEPLEVARRAEQLYESLISKTERVGTNDEHDLFLGELALSAGSADRILFRIDAATVWLLRAERCFSMTKDADAHLAHVAYQRLAIALEERHLDEVLRLAPRCAATFHKLEMPEDALKCRFLEGVAYSEGGDTDGAIRVHLDICAEAEKIGNDRLAALAANNLSLQFAEVGELEKSLEFARKALPLLQRLGSRVHLVKLQVSVGNLNRKQGKRGLALDAYRRAQAEAAELGLRGDVAAIHLMVADLLLDARQEAQAESEIRAALPIMDELKMVPEGLAALTLLRESLRRRQIDKQALRDLHDYFRK